MILARCSIGDREDPVYDTRVILEGMVAAHSIAGWDDPRLEEARWDIRGADGGPCLILRVKPTNSPKAYLLVFPIEWLLAEMVDIVLVMES